MKVNARPERATFWSRDTLEGVMQDEEGFRSLRKTVKRFLEFLKKYEGGLGNNGKR